MKAKQDKREKPVSLGFREKLESILGELRFGLSGAADLREDAPMPKVVILGKQEAVSAILKLIREEVEKIDPLEANYCGEWDEPDVIACGVHRYILGQLVGKR